MVTVDLPIIQPPAFWNAPAMAVKRGAGYQRTADNDRKLSISGDLVTKKDEGFHILVDVIHYTPSEVTAKAVGDALVIGAKHEEQKAGHGTGYVERSFTRKYDALEGMDPKSAKLEILPDGYLEITIVKEN